MNLTSQPELRPGLRLHAAAPVLASCPRRPVDKALVHAVVVALQVEDLQERDSIGLKNRPKIGPKKWPRSLSCRHLIGFLGPSLNDKTILFLFMLLDKTVSVG